MQLLISALLVWALPFGFLNATAQQKKSTLSKSAQETKKVFQDLFQKKTNTDSIKTVESRYGPTNKSEYVHYTVTPGQMASNAKLLDVDMLLPFNQGTAMIRKGNATALIDTAANFIVPFGKYTFVAGTEKHPNFKKQIVHNGIFQYLAYMQNPGAFLNTKGKLLATSTSEQLYTYTPNRQMIYFLKQWRTLQPNGTEVYTKQYTYMNNEGRKYVFNAEVKQLSEDVFTLTSGHYITKEGKQINKEPFDEVEPFSNGMALVGKIDAFGQMKYGYINAEGKLVVPLQFTLKPGHFNGGYAKVFPKNKSDFEYAYINQQGEIVFKQTYAQQQQYGTFQHFNTFGFAYSGHYVLNSQLQIMKRQELMAAMGLPPTMWPIDSRLEGVEGENDPKLFISGPIGKEGMFKNISLIGFVNTKSKTIVLPAFYKIDDFDPVSGLAYAEAIIGRDRYGTIQLQKGYINDRGLFVIVQSKGGTW